MDPMEEEELESIPDKFQPISAWGYFWYSVLFMIPVIGWICLTVFAFSGHDINRRSFSRSYFVAFFVLFALFLTFEAVCLIFGSDTVLSTIQSFLHIELPYIS